ncbi:hypothetical protein NBRC116594_15880 [Shimia sp. NS0008-38b]
MGVGQFLRDPFFHFAVLAGAVFGYFHLIDASPDAEPDNITFSVEEVAVLAARMQKTLSRPPSPDEVTQYLDQLVTEEALVREALALGMDQGDGVIRQRLAQKMRFLVDGAAQAAVPDPDVLRAYFDENQRRYATAQTYTFTQVFFGNLENPDELTTALEALNAGADPATVGERTGLPSTLTEASARQVEGVFGRGFVPVLDPLTLNVWSGPVTSAFGVHAVKVTSVAPEVVPAFEEVQAAVLTDWRDAQAAILQQDMLVELVAQYEVTLPEPAEIAAVLAQ